jgi:hypothetical protein
MSNTSWLTPFLMLFLAPAVTSAVRPRTSASLLRLLTADLIAIALGLSIHAIKPDALYWIWTFYASALAALLLTGSLLGAALRFGIDTWYARIVARRPSSQ